MLRAANWFTLISAAMLIYSVVAIWAGWLSGRAFPVVSLATITEVVPLDRMDRRGNEWRDYDVMLDFDKGRPCEYLTLEFYYPDGARIGHRYLGPIKGSREVKHWADVGPWRLSNVDPLILTQMRIFAVHQCGGPWWNVAWLKWWRWPWLTYTEMTPK